MAPDILHSARDVIKSGSLDTIQLAKKKYASLLEPLCTRYGLTKTEMDVLLFLANNPDFDRAADIVNLRRITKSHVSVSVSHLEELGLLRKVGDESDRRSAHLKLTEAAVPIAEAGNRIQQDFFGRVFAGLSAEELDLWRQILDKVCRNIQSLEK